MPLRCCIQYISKFGKLSCGPRTGRSVFIPIPQKGNAKECSSYHTIALVSHASKVMLKILQARLQQYVNSEIPDVQAEFRKGRGTRDQIASVHWIIEKAREFQKNILVSSVAQLCPTLCGPMDCSTPGLPVHHQLPSLLKLMSIESVMPFQTSHPLSSPSPLAFNLSQHQGLFQ